MVANIAHVDLRMQMELKLRRHPSTTHGLGMSLGLHAADAACVVCVDRVCPNMLW